MACFRFPGVLVLGLLAACAGEVPAPVELELADSPLASGADGPVRSPDGRLEIPDGRTAADARTADASFPDAPGTCSVNGVPGECIDATTCADMPNHVATPGHCPGPANIQCCTVKGASMATCDPSAVPEPNAGLVEEPGEGGCPAGMLRIAGSSSAGFCIDRFEASLELVSDAGETSPWSPYFNPGAHRVIARSFRGAVPQGYMTGEEAKGACEEAGKRLCTDTEWLRACRGPDGNIFPYGNTRETGVCNDHRDLHPAVELFGSVTNLTSPCINELHDTIDRTGSRTGCTTAEGAYDMVGNLHEWTADEAGTFRGGFYVDTIENGPGCLYVTTAHNTLHYDYSTGFRCCTN